MTPERWQEIQQHLDQLLQLPKGDRTRYLETIGQQDAALRNELESLLEGEEENLVEALADQLSDQKTTSVSYQAGEVVGTYVLRELLGRGGMGDVWLAERTDPAFKQKLALKVIRKGMDSAEILQRFHTERQILAQLNHPNIARLLDGGATHEGVPYFVMEFVDGLPLQTYADEHRLTIEERIGLFRQVCEAVHYAHQNLVVHRDLKPSNILVTSDGQVKLLDFGIAKVMDPAPMMIEDLRTRPELRILTPAYASPEQIKGESISTASDVYSLGVLLYELLTGSRPYPIATRAGAEIVRVILEEEPSKPSTAISEGREILTREGTTHTLTPEDISSSRRIAWTQLQRKLRGDMDNIVLKALRKEPERRYTSAGQFAEDLDRFLKGLPVIAQADTITYRVQKFIRRNRIGVAASVAFLVLLLAFSGTTLWQNRLIKQERDNAKRARDKSEKVTSVLLELFNADPYTTEDINPDSISIRQFLFNTEEQVQRELAGDPEIRAILQSLLGRLHGNLGDFKHSVTLLEEAERTLRQKTGELNPYYADCLNFLATTYQYQGDYEKSLRMFRKVLEIRRQLYPDSLHWTIPEALNNISGVLDDRGDPKDMPEAEQLTHEALRLRRIIFGNNHPDVAQALNNVAVSYYRKKEYALAEKYYTEALTIRKQTLGLNHANTANTLNNLANNYREQKRFTEAEQFFQEAIRIYKAKLGPEHPRVANSYYGLSKVYRAQKNYPKAIAAIQENIRIQQIALPTTHPSYAGSFVFYADVLTEAGQKTEARGWYQKALDVVSKNEGAESEDAQEIRQKIQVLGG